MKNKMRAMMLMLLMCWASLSLAQPTRAVLWGATWPSNSITNDSLGKVACSRLMGAQANDWSYSSECKVTKILKPPKLGKLEHIGDDNYIYIPNGSLGNDRFVILVENTEGRKAIVTMRVEVYEESGALTLPLSPVSAVGWAEA